MGPAKLAPRAGSELARQALDLLEWFTPTGDEIPRQVPRAYPDKTTSPPNPSPEDQGALRRSFCFGGAVPGNHGFSFALL